MQIQSSPILASKQPLQTCQRTFWKTKATLLTDRIYNGIYLPLSSVKFSNCTKFLYSTFNASRLNNLFGRVHTPFLKTNDPCSIALKVFFKDEAKNVTLNVLQGGLSGATNFKVLSKGKVYVLRVLNPKEPTENRESEIKSALYAGERKIGPMIHYAAPDSKVMIMDFVKGQTLTPSIFRDNKKLQALVQTIRCLHESKGDFPNGWTVFERISRQLEALKHSQIPFPGQSVENAIKKLNAIAEIFRTQPLVPCHNDLSALNILSEGETFKIIDWTDSGKGYSYNDLGYFVLVNGVDKGGQLEILTAYLGRAPSDLEMRHLDLMKKVNMLRIFASNFPAYELPVQDVLLREMRTKKIEEKLSSSSLQEHKFFFDLHAAGNLKGKEIVIDLSLSALRSFLKDA